MPDAEWQVPAGYPHLLSDDELREALEQMTAVPRTSRFHSVNTSLQTALIQVGVMEQSRRETERATTTSRRIAYVSLVVAAVALLLSLGFGVVDYRGDTDWQSEQTKLLTQIRDEHAGR
jgi:hypothetical protein